MVEEDVVVHVVLVFAGEEGGEGVKDYETAGKARCESVLEVVERVEEGMFGGNVLDEDFREGFRDGFLWIGKKICLIVDGC